MTIAEIVSEKGEHHNQIKATTLSNGYLVSTVEITPLVKVLNSFLGSMMEVTGTTLDELAEMTESGFRADLDTPGNYETMVFRKDSVRNDEVGFQRYMSREEAEEGHKEMVEKWRRM